MNTTSVSCPVDGVKVNENKVRTTAFFVWALMSTYLLTTVWVIPALLLADFALRAFNFGQWSPLGWLSGRFVKAFRLPVQMIDQGPKRFAAGIGLVFSTTILAFHLLGLNPLLLASIITLFAALEAFAGFCAGCHVYTLLQPILRKK
ncbi:DUF4395 domain-containing protein [Larkinella insperata]|uniref:DUF4395 domain-containing protein n=1 Tax=Larkinella insperata TaxID=332158 RepID=A0ABW3QJN8_9BACT|nr:DUF4395 domain-containing protein [Larkinella insperata]